MVRADRELVGCATKSDQAGMFAALTGDTIMRFSELSARLRELLPPSSSSPVGPTPGRELEVWIDGLTPAALGLHVGDVLRFLRLNLDQRLGEHDLQVRHHNHERVGYRTWLRDDADLRWLRTRVMAAAARWPAAACLRVRVAETK